MKRKNLLHTLDLWGLIQVIFKKFSSSPFLRRIEGGSLVIKKNVQDLLEFIWGIGNSVYLLEDV
jgi:hypothetical protein